MQKINEINDSPKLTDYIENANQMIFDEDVWKNKGLRKVAEVTYSYNNETNINETLFVKIWGIDLEKFCLANSDEKILLINNAGTEVSKVLEQKITLIDNALDEVSLGKFGELDEEDTIKKDIFINALFEKKHLLEYALIALPIEVEKALWFQQISEEEMSITEWKLKKLDEEIYWGDIKNNPEETVLAYESFYSDYLQNKENLSKEEQEKIEYYLNKVMPYFPEGYKFSPKEVPHKIDAEFLEKNISREDYLSAFNLVSWSFKGMIHTAQSDPNAASISDGPDGVDFPATKKFDQITLERFMKLSNHEFETHCVTDQNNKSLLWNLRWAESTTKDEWIAILMEHILLYGNALYKEEDGKTIIDKSKLQINTNFFKILMCEVLNSEELEDFLELSYKVKKDIISPSDRYKRLKRNNKNHGQHKDTSYTRWALQAVDEINKYIKSEWKEWISLENMFIWKISFKETNSLVKLKEIKEKKWESMTILKPLFIAEAVYYFMSNRSEILEEKWKGNFSREKFITYLQNKYPIIDFNDELLDDISFWVKRRVLEISKMFTKAIENQ